MSKSTVMVFHSRTSSLVAWLVLAAACLVSPSIAIADVTGVTGSGAPVDDMQPSLAMNYLINIQGDFDRLGEVVPFAGNFAPGGWALAQGQLLVVGQNTDLFQKLGTTYGGNGVQTFALPDLSGRTAIGTGQGNGLSNRTLGAMVGVEDVALTMAQMPAHDHTLPFGGNTSATGGNASFTNMQPSLALNYAVPLQAPFPTPLPINTTPFLSQVRLFASTTLPAGHADAGGQLLTVNGNEDLFTLIGTTYGGNGVQTFALPDLRGRTPIQTGQGVGLSNRTLGQSLGTEDVTLSASQLPVHDHTLPPTADVTGMTGGNQPFDEMQPSLALNYIICTEGAFPAPGTNPGNLSFLGQIALMAGDTVPSNWALAQGQLIPIVQNTALFAVLGITFGGNGTTSFALPDLRGRTIIGTGDGPGLENRLPGEQAGQEALALTVSQLPPHVHNYIPEPSTLPLALVSLFVTAGLRRLRMPRAA